MAGRRVDETSPNRGNLSQTLRDVMNAIDNCQSPQELSLLMQPFLEDIDAGARGILEARDKRMREQALYDWDMAKERQFPSQKGAIKRFWCEMMEQIRCAAESKRQKRN